MAEYIFESEYKNNSRLVKVRLFLVHFEDENNIHIIYSPYLDLSGYGASLEEAKKSFKIVYEDFIDYTLKKKTIAKVLTDLGWELKGSVKKPKKLLLQALLL